MLFRFVKCATSEKGHCRASAITTVTYIDDNLVQKNGLAKGLSLQLCSPNTSQSSIQSYSQSYIHRGETLKHQFFKLCSGAGIRPPREIKSELDSECTGITGAEPKRPPKATSSPTVLPGAGIKRTAVVF